LDAWLDTLGAARFVTFMCDSVAKRFEHEGFCDWLDAWLETLGAARFVTFMCGSVATRFEHEGFCDWLDHLLEVVSKDQFVSIVSAGAARFESNGFIDWVNSLVYVIPQEIGTLLRETPVTALDHPMFYQRILRIVGNPVIKAKFRIYDIANSSTRWILLDESDFDLLLDCNTESKRGSNFFDEVTFNAYRNNTAAPEPTKSKRWTCDEIKLLHAWVDRNGSFKRKTNPNELRDFGLPADVERCRSKWKSESKKQKTQD